MSFFDSINIAATGLAAESTRMNVTAENLANAETTVGPDGKPYAPQEVVLESVPGSFGSTLADAMGGSGNSTPGGVEVAGIVSANTKPQLVYDPGNPEANKAGYVEEPNIQPVTEMVNLIDESNDYQADVTAMQTAKSMYSATLNLLK
jgi:flagellar basal-body rod protein FlgC